METPNLMKLVDNEDELFREQGQEPSGLQTHHLWVDVELGSQGRCGSQSRGSVPEGVAVFGSAPESLKN